MNPSNPFSVCLVSPPSRATSSRPPLGLMYLASNVREKHPGVQVEILDFKSSSGTEEVTRIILDSIRAKKPDLVGISCLSTDLADVRELTSEIKGMDTEITTVVGGIHSTLYPEYFFETTDNVDYAVMGEGEIILVELIKMIREGGDPGQIDGIAFRQNGKIQVNKRRDPIRDMDQLPFPAYDLVDMEYYTRPSEWVIRGVPISGFFIFTSRGCPYKCSFCVNKNLSERMVRQRTARNVVDELEFLVKKYHIDGFFIYDDSFGLNKKRVFEVCEELKKRKMRMVWGCQARVNLISEEMVKTMRESGCVQLEFGVESGSKKVLKQLRKQITVDEVRKTFQLCDKYHIRKLANFLINVPGETERDIEETISLAREIGANVNLFNVTTLFPGSDLSSEFEGDIPEEDLVKFASQEDFEEFLALIEDKYRLSAHDIPLSELLAKLSETFPMRGRLAIRWNAAYLAQMWKLISFVFDKKYLGAVIHSRKKKAYVNLLFSLIRQFTVK